MPPDTANGDGSTREENNPVRVLAERLLAWQKAGFPDTFQLAPVGDTNQTPAPPYLLSPKLGRSSRTSAAVSRTATAMLDPISVANPFADEMRQKDALFAGSRPRTICRTRSSQPIS